MKKIFFFSIVGVFLFSQSILAEPTNTQLAAKLDQLTQQMTNLQKSVTEQQSVIQQQANEITQLKSVRIEKPREGFYVPPEGAEGVEAPGWLDGLKFSGDLRLRWEAIDYTEDEQLTGFRDRNRFRFQLRYGFVKQMFDDLELGFRISSGGNAAPTSTNDTFDTSFQKKLIWIDRVWATYTPEFVDGLEVTAGKFKNPFVTTDIIWDTDVNPEGIYEKYDFSLFDGKVKPFVTLGQMVIQEDAVGAPGDAELFAYQGGFSWQVDDDFMEGKPLKVKAATSYYNYTDYNVAGAFFAAGNNPVNPGNGNLAVNDFDLIDVYLETSMVPLTIQEEEIPLKLFTHFVKNMDGDAFVTATTTEDEDYAYSYGLQLGNLKDPGDWKLKWRYSYIGPNAVPSYFVDANFGGTNARGIEANLAYRLRKNLDVEFTGNITGAMTGGDVEQRMFHTDLKMTF